MPARTPRFPVERNSFAYSEVLAREIWGIAEKQKLTAFAQELGDTVQDDHIQLQYVGIPAIDIIDFSYRHWHRLTDTPDACAPEGMAQVARVLTVWMQRVK